MPELEGTSQLNRKYGKRFKPNEIIFKEGDQGDHLYIIQQGRVQISQKVQGKDKILMVLEAGDFFGEMAIIDVSERSATAMATEETVALVLNGEGVIQAMSQNGKLALSLIQQLVRRLKNTNQKLKDVQSKNVSALVIHALIELNQIHRIDENGYNCFHLEDKLSEQLEIEKEEIREVLASMEEIHLIAIRNRTVYIKNMEELIHLNSLLRKSPTQKSS